VPEQSKNILLLTRPYQK